MLLQEQSARVRLLLELVVLPRESSGRGRRGRTPEGLHRRDGAEGPLRKHHFLVHERPRAKVRRLYIVV